jgi:hypothetical protein
LGRDTTKPGDQIFNGAVDNASGTAALLELARAFASLTPAPRRSILLSLTAEGRGCSAPKWYATHPLYPLTGRANISIDGVNQWEDADIVVIGLGNSTGRHAPTARAEPTHPRRRAGKGFLLPQRPFRVRKEGRTGALHRARHALHRQGRFVFAAEARRVHREGLSQAFRRD